MKRDKNDKYRKWLAQLPCVICGDGTSTEACHVKFSLAAIAKANPGNQRKIHDYYCVPLCGAHHRLQHSRSERAFWIGSGIDPHRLAFHLFCIFITGGDYVEGYELVEATRLEAQWPTG